jgi:hypothetical protein
MLLDVKRSPLIDDEKNKQTTITLNHSEIEVLMETLSFAKTVYANSAKNKKMSDSPEDSRLAFNLEYSSLLVEELIEKIIKEGRLTDYGGVLH